LIVGIGTFVGSVAIASLAFCLSIIIFTLSTPRSSVDSTRNNQIILGLTAGMTGLVGLAVLENRRRAVLKKKVACQNEDKDRDSNENNYFG